MANETVTVIARITAQADKVEEMSSILAALIEPTRRGQGCISYHLFQNKADVSDFTFIEEWVSDAAIDAHMATPHVQNAFSGAGPLLAKEPDIRRYAMIA